MKTCDATVFLILLHIIESEKQRAKGDNVLLEIVMFVGFSFVVDLEWVRFVGVRWAHTFRIHYEWSSK